MKISQDEFNGRLSELVSEIQLANNIEEEDALEMTKEFVKGWHRKIRRFKTSSTIKALDKILKNENEKLDRDELLYYVTYLKEALNVE